MPCAALAPHCSRALAQPSSSWCAVAPVQETARETLAQVEATPAELTVEDVKNREWTAMPANKGKENTYEATLPVEAADWFAVVSDERPVPVSGDLIHLEKQTHTGSSSRCCDKRNVLTNSHVRGRTMC
jgi:hypothetical protein